ncbi:SPASM domain peptide maturase of grasp-with-spasm system [Epilithonimonas hungarica]|uniref:grasp-with-spasm system SPASM domain peptide maturase n=1 Tax=Epilithonimonas hungarica TaxID=454006 RepID=UPI002789EB65|nr:grasp-with-spasm system SPASM domain peptide maturase [Epilithonimonas hungarica]MDP9956590.1 SPASM domain peptide maturase of grasp-with-spasm system [Epilithonimonas hungarica]
MFLKLFSSCKIVKGFHQSIILDVQRSSYTAIPNSMYSIIKELEHQSIDIVESQIEQEDKEIFKSYISFLIENEFVFITNDPQKFKYHDYSSSSTIKYNGILELKNLETNLKKIVSEFAKIKIEALHINIYEGIDLEKTKLLLSQFLQNTDIKQISLLIGYNKNIVEKDVLDLGFNYPILSQIMVYDSPFEKEVQDSFMRLFFLQDKKISYNSCGVVNESYFSCNSVLYNESHCINSCLAGKIAIDVEGNVRNCLSMTQSFGNIKDTTLEKVMHHKDFKKYWNLTKDKIEVCKDCEFRYICTDCRAYTERTHFTEENLDISKPLKCGYDPYTGEWEDWTKSPLKKKAVEFYGMLKN